MLYSLRYENDDKVNQLKQILKQQRGVSDDQLNQIDSLLEYAGKQKRKRELFASSSMINNTKRFLNSMFGEDVKNVLL